MHPTSSVFGFQRCEEHEEQDVYDAEYELAEHNLPAVGLLGISFRAKEKHQSDEIVRGEPSAVGVDPMTGARSIAGLQQRKQPEKWVAKEEDRQFLLQLDLGVSGLAVGSTTSVFGFRRRKHEKQEVADVVYWDSQHTGRSGFPSNCFGFDKKKAEQDEQQDFGVSGSANSCKFGFERKQRVGDELESAFLEENPGGLSLPSLAARDIASSEKEKRCKPCVEVIMGMEKGGRELPHELVEKIMAMVPFPEIMYVRFLSKTWHSNFSSTPESASFRNQVTSVSSRWKQYCPIILNVEEQWVVGFDRERKRWQKIPMGFEHQGLSSWFSTQKLRGAGCLMAGVFNRSKIFVTNILAKTWKWLPARPNMEYPNEIHLLPIGCDAYEVLLMTKLEKRTNEICCQLYDSRTMSWTIKYSMVDTALFNSSSVYLNGFVYVIEYDPDDYQDCLKLLAYNVEDGSWSNIPHPFGFMLHEIETYELLVCQSQVMVVLHLHSTWWTRNPIHNTFRNTLMVYRLDPVSLDIREVSRGPPEPSTASSTLFASDNDHIYFGNPQVESSSFVELNVTTCEWSCLPPPTCTDGSFKNKWGTFPFQPGLNPFALV